jgi:hypothetical protein
VFKAGAGLVAGVVAGGLGLALLPRLDKHAITPRSAVEKPQFVVASVPAPSAPQPVATLAVATEAAAAKPSPAATAAPEKIALRPGVVPSPPATVAESKPLAPVAPPAKPAVVAAAEAPPTVLTRSVTLNADTPAPAKPAPEDAARWSVRGLVALSKGDLSNARLFLTRAAEAGDARAWVALADTYDPAMLAKFGVVFAPGDALRARDCLVKAVAAGVVVPKDRLAALDSGAQPVR